MKTEQRAFVLLLTISVWTIPSMARAGAWTPTDNMVVGSVNQSFDALLPDGKVLVTDGWERSSAEVFDPGRGAWSLTGSMTTGRNEPTFTPLLDGRVLVTGGYPSASSAEVYDPTNATFGPTGFMNEGRQTHTAVRLQDGRVLVAGGRLCCYIPRSSAEIWNPSSGRFTLTGSMSTARISPRSVLLQDGRVLIVGGFDGVTGAPLASAEVYNPATERFTSAGSLTTARGLTSLTLLTNGKVLVAGGVGLAGFLTSAELFDPSRGEFQTTRSMAIARSSHTATVLADGTVLIAGGENAGGLINSAEIYNPATESFAVDATMINARASHTATRLADGRVLVAGGVGPTTTQSNPFRAAEVFAPAPKIAACDQSTSIDPGVLSSTRVTLNDGRRVSVDDTPLAGLADAVVNFGCSNHVDPRFIMSIAAQESLLGTANVNSVDQFSLADDGKFFDGGSPPEEWQWKAGTKFCGKFNPFGLLFSKSRAIVNCATERLLFVGRPALKFDSWSRSIEYLADLLAASYLYSSPAETTVDSIAPIYSSPAEGPGWSAGVKRVLDELGGNVADVRHPEGFTQGAVKRKFKSSLFSDPADIIIVDPDGLRIGVDSTTGQTINEIGGASFSGRSSEPTTIEIQDPKEGIYTILLTGIADTPYFLMIFGNSSSGVFNAFNTEGDLQTGQTITFPIRYSTGSGVAQFVAVDIKPGSSPNIINPRSKGKIPVAVLSAPAFDAPASIDISSLTFGRTGDEQSLVFCNQGGEDVNGDGLLDLVCHFDSEKVEFESGDSVGVLKGKTTTRSLIIGTDSVLIVH